jgi:surfeit locus 1 family protein
VQGRVGFYVITPLQLEGHAEAVLVQRGWVPRDLRDRTFLPQVPTPAGVVELQGHLAPPPARLYEFSQAASGVIRQNLELASFAAESGLRLIPYSVLQAASPNAGGAASSDGLLRAWPQPAVDVHKHYGYAFQWFALSALITGLYVWFQLIRPRFQRGQPQQSD